MHILCAYTDQNLAQQGQKNSKSVLSALPTFRISAWDRTCYWEGCKIKTITNLLPESAGSWHWRCFGKSSYWGCPLVKTTWRKWQVGKIIKERFKIAFLVHPTSTCLLLFALQLLLSITLFQGLPHLKISVSPSLVKVSTSLTSSSSTSSSVPCNCSTMKSEKSPRLANSSA